MPTLSAEAAWNVTEATRPSDGAYAALAESLHPHHHECDYTDSLRVQGARVLLVVFDPQCSLGRSAQLDISATPDFASIVRRAKAGAASMGAECWQPLVVEGDTLHFRFSCRSSAPFFVESKAGSGTTTTSFAFDPTAWGFRLYVAPLRGLQWLRESKCFSDASLEWACWLLDWLLQERAAIEQSASAAASAAPGASSTRSAAVLQLHKTVQSPALVAALARYVRTVGVPFKGRVVNLLTQVLRHFSAEASAAPAALAAAAGSNPFLAAAAAAHLPDFTVFRRFEAAVLRRCEEEMSRSAVFLPPQLQALVELCLTARLAQRNAIAAANALPGSAAAASGFGPGSAPFGTVGGSAGDASARSGGSGGGFLSSLFRTSSGSGSGSGAGSASSRASQRITVVREPIVDPATQPAMALLAELSDCSDSLTRGVRLPDVLVCTAVQQAYGRLDDRRLQECVLTAASPWDASVDAKLVKWAAAVATARGTDPLHLPPACLEDGGPGTERDSLELSALAAVPSSTLVLRFAVLQLLNDRLSRVIHLVDLGGGGSGAGAGASAGTADGSDASASGSGSSGAGAGSDDGGSLAARLRRLSHVIFPDAKARLVETAIDMTWYPGGSGLAATLSNALAFQSLDAGVRDIALSNCIFMQLWRQIGGASGRHFRTRMDSRGRVVAITFAGEEGLDWGGLSRDALTRAVDDAFSDRLDLFLPVPNAGAAAAVTGAAAAAGSGGGAAAGSAGAAGDGGAAALNAAVLASADKFVPNPSHCTGARRAIPMWEFIGRLMGHSARHKQNYAFLLAPLVWKALAGQPLGLDDVRTVDNAAASRIARAEAVGLALEADASGATVAGAAVGGAGGAGAGAAGAGSGAAGATGSDPFEEALGPATGAADGGCSFTVRSVTGRLVELLPGGRSLRVNASNWRQFVALATQAKAHEFDPAIAALRRGLMSVLPERAVRMLSWSELELLVCGDPHVDVDILAAHTEYSGYSRSDRTIRMFWEVMRSLSDEERSRFVRFASGRSRLPRGPAAWERERPFKITRRGGGDDAMPVAHSCFNAVELPAYSSVDIMRKRLLAALNFGLDAFLIA